MRYAPETGPLELPAPAAPVFARRWRGTGDEAVVLVHGMESHSEWFETVGPRLAAEGVTALAYDRRGWGRSDGRPGHLSHPDAALSELAAVVASLKSTHRTVHVIGLSWGGLLALYAAARQPDLVSSVTALVPALFVRRELPLAQRARVAIGALTRLPLDVLLPMSVEDFTRDPAAQAFIRADARRRTRVTSAFCVTTLRMQAAVRASGKLTPRTQILLAAEDALVANAPTLAFAAGAGLTAATLPGTIHSLVFEDPAGVAARAIAFMRAQPPSRQSSSPSAAHAS
jgi:alpha-beta hydrolase superfamily lysophospholipase